MLREYLLAIKDISPSDKEHTYRTSLHNLLSNIIESLRGGANITITHEPNNSKEGFGAPDFLIRKDSLVLGYIENKRINTSLDEVAKGKQIEKYFHLSNHIILTDYLRFCLLCKNEKGEIIVANELRICEYDELKAIIKDRAFIEGKQKELLDFFSLFLSKNPNSINNAKDFADALALRTKILKDELLANKDSRHISGLYNTFREVLYKELSFEDFCDSFAQTLTYSLFLSRLNNNTNESITLVNAKQFIPKSFPLIRAMSGFLEELDELDSIKWLIGEIIGIINHIDIVEMIKELNKISQKELFGDSLHKDPYLHFYETFLCSYDRALREVRGVYYTPLPVVRFIIESIDFILRNDFGKNDGLANALSDETITLLDFATGTGTFLLEAFRKALGDIPQNSPKYNPKALIHRFYGFEFLIAPYTIAHLKLSQSFKEEFCAELGDKESLNIALTNTLYFSKESDEIEKNRNLWGGLIDLNEEFLKAQSLKEKEILIITGNPPYSGASSNKGLYEDEVKITYGLEPSLSHLNENEKKQIEQYFKERGKKENIKTFKAIFAKHKLQNEKNPKWLLDDYVKFIRFGESRIEAKGQGVFAFISNNGFLDNPTFRGMRHHLLSTFDRIYILDLHGSARKKECTPNGGKDDNVFDIMQGVSINIFVKFPPKGVEITQSCNRDIVKLSSNNVLGVGKRVVRKGEGNASQVEPLPLNNSDKVATNKGVALGLEKGKISIVINKSVSGDWGSKGIRGRTSQFKPPCPLERDKKDTSLLQSEAINTLARIYHYDLYGKRKDKYSFLLENAIDSTPWRELSPKAPFYLFVPQNEHLREEYDRGWSVKDIFQLSNTGVVTKRDNLCIQQTKEKAWEAVQDIINLEKRDFYTKYKMPEDVRDWRYEWARKDALENGSEDKIQKISYRPFDTRYIFYSGQSRGFVGWPVPIVSEHFLQDSNIGLVYKRGFPHAQSGHCFITKNIIDFRSWSSAGMQGGDYVSPLYRFESKEKIENLTPKFRNFIDAKYGEVFTPEEILGYIYAILFHKKYREKYLDFLKIDFPKIPFVDSKEAFMGFSALGVKLIALHLLRDSSLDSSVGVPLYKDERNDKIEKIAYIASEKRLFVNSSLHFSNVAQNVWEYKIGGYQVLDKYLKSHKGEEIGWEHFQKIIQTLHKSLKLESEIAKMAFW